VALVLAFAFMTGAQPVARFGSIRNNTSLSAPPSSSADASEAIPWILRTLANAGCAPEDIAKRALACLPHGTHP
jgi:hypothetical protein